MATLRSFRAQSSSPRAVMSIAERMRKNEAALKDLQALTEAARQRIDAADKYLGRSISHSILREEEAPKKPLADNEETTLPKTSKSSSDIQKLRPSPSAPRASPSPGSSRVLRERQQHVLKKSESSILPQKTSIPLDSQKNLSKTASVPKKVLSSLLQSPPTAEAKKSAALLRANTTSDLEKVIPASSKSLSPAQTKRPPLRKPANDEPEDVRCLKAKIAVNHEQIQSLRAKVTPVVKEEQPKPVELPEEIKKTKGRRLVLLLRGEISKQQSQIRQLQGRLFSRFNRNDKARHESKKKAVKEPQGPGPSRTRPQKATSTSKVLKHL
ncbi:hypothetical protein QR680_016092 [Steinernema hermaphroditum]|uniref:Uncharacterized protein n=1 Tax=Steinernema hermaphroditum TaxID=289476 RepID=A0AA39HA17_9BILA|nr:hypothetical protein QR680_016092 [Steinernema hermaphroditum]